METILKRICQMCRKTVPLSSTSCDNCGIPFPDGDYAVVTDGMSIGIAFKGKMKLHGMDGDKAQQIAAIMNTTKA